MRWRQGSIDHLELRLHPRLWCWASWKGKQCQWSKVCVPQWQPANQTSLTSGGVWLPVSCSSDPAYPGSFSPWLGKVCNEDGVVLPPAWFVVGSGVLTAPWVLFILLSIEFALVICHVFWGNMTLLSSKLSACRKTFTGVLILRKGSSLPRKKPTELTVSQTPRNSTVTSMHWAFLKSADSVSLLGESLAYIL